MRRRLILRSTVLPAVFLFSGMFLSGCLMRKSSAGVVSVSADATLTTRVVDGRNTALDNTGATTELPLSADDILLLNFDLSSVKGRKITAARLYLHLTAGRLETVLVSTVNGPVWQEGDGKGDRRPGAVSFSQAAAGQTDWSFPGSDFSDVSFGRGGSHDVVLTVYDISEEEARDMGPAWGYIDLPPEILAPLTASISNGLAIRSNDDDACRINAKEYGEKEVFLKLSVGGEIGEPDQVLAPVIPIDTLDVTFVGRFLEPGEAALTWRVPESDTPLAGYRIRAVPVKHSVRQVDKAVSVPPDRIRQVDIGNGVVGALVSGLDPETSWSFDVTAVYEYGWESQPATAFANGIPVIGSNTLDIALNSDSVFTGDVTPFTRSQVDVMILPGEARVNPVSGAVTPALSAPGVSIESRNAVFDAATGGVALSGPRGAWVDFQVAIRSDMTLTDVSVSLNDNGDASIFKTARFYRVWYLPGPPKGFGTGQWWGDPLVPLAGAFNIPAHDNAVPGQTAQQVYGEIFIPYDVPANPYAGLLKVGYTTPDGQSITREFPLTVTPDDVDLPKKDGFYAELFSRGNLFALHSASAESALGHQVERDWRREAFLNRTNLTIWPLSDNGELAVRDMGPIVAGDSKNPVLDFTLYDARMSAYLDGRAFEDLGRGRVGAPYVILPVGVNYPVGASRSGSEFDPSFINARLKEFTLKQWTKHIAQFTDETGESPIIQVCMGGVEDIGGDSLSLEFPSRYLDLNKILTALDFSDAGYDSVWTRVVSPYTHIWTGAPDAPDIIVEGAVFCDRNPGEQLAVNGPSQMWNYGTPTAPWDAGTAMRAWPWVVYRHGGNGLIVLNADVGRDLWQVAKAGALFYPAEIFGETGVYPSLRIKALRNGVQDVETLMALGKETWRPNAFRRAVNGYLQQAILRMGGESVRVLTPTDFLGIVRSAIQQVADNRGRWRENLPAKLFADFEGGEPRTEYLMAINAAAFALTEPLQGAIGSKHAFLNACKAADGYFAKALDVAGLIRNEPAAVTEPPAVVETGATDLETPPVDMASSGEGNETQPIESDVIIPAERPDTVPDARSVPDVSATGVSNSDEGDVNLPGSTVSDVEAVGVELSATDSTGIVVPELDTSVTGLLDMGVSDILSPDLAGTALPDESGSGAVPSMSVTESALDSERLMEVPGEARGAAGNVAAPFSPPAPIEIKLNMKAMDKGELKNDSAPERKKRSAKSDAVPAPDNIALPAPDKAPPDERDFGVE